MLSREECAVCRALEACGVGTRDQSACPSDVHKLATVLQVSSGYELKRCAKCRTLYWYAESYDYNAIGPSSQEKSLWRLTDEAQPVVSDLLHTGPDLDANLAEALTDPDSAIADAAATIFACRAKQGERFARAADAAAVVLGRGRSGGVYEGLRALIEQGEEEAKAARLAIERHVSPENARGLLPPAPRPATKARPPAPVAPKKAEEPAPRPSAPSPPRLDAWNAAGFFARRKMKPALQAIADAAYERDAPSYPHSVAKRPVFDVFASEKRGALLIVSIVYHYRYDVYAQSGSDWGEHFICTADVTFERGQCKGHVETRKERRDGIPESALKEYDDAAVAAGVRDAALRQMLS